MLVARVDGSQRVGRSVGIRLRDGPARGRRRGDPVASLVVQLDPAFAVQPAPRVTQPRLERALDEGDVRLYDIHHDVHRAGLVVAQHAVRVLQVVQIERQLGILRAARRVHVRAGEHDVQPRRRRGILLRIRLSAFFFREIATRTRTRTRRGGARVEVRVEQRVEERYAVHARHEDVAHHHGELLAAVQALERGDTVRLVHHAAPIAEHALALVHEEVRLHALVLDVQDGEIGAHRAEVRVVQRVVERAARAGTRVASQRVVDRTRARDGTRGRVIRSSLGRPRRRRQRRAPPPPPVLARVRVREVEPVVRSVVGRLERYARRLLRARGIRRDNALGGSILIRRRCRRRRRRRRTRGVRGQRDDVQRDASVAVVSFRVSRVGRGALFRRALLRETLAALDDGPQRGDARGSRAALALPVPERVAPRGGDPHHYLFRRDPHPGPRNAAHAERPPQPPQAPPPKLHLRGAETLRLVANASSRNILLCPLRTRTRALEIEADALVRAVRRRGEVLHGDAHAGARRERRPRERDGAARRTVSVCFFLFFVTPRRGGALRGQPARAAHDARPRAVDEREQAARERVSREEAHLVRRQRVVQHEGRVLVEQGLGQRARVGDDLVHILQVRHVHGLGLGVRAALLERPERVRVMRALLVPSRSARARGFEQAQGVEHHRRERDGEVGVERHHANVVVGVVKRLRHSLDANHRVPPGLAVVLRIVALVRASQTRVFPREPIAPEPLALIRRVRAHRRRHVLAVSAAQRQAAAIGAEAMSVVALVASRSSGGGDVGVRLQRRRGGRGRERPAEPV
mmetsp:Transcript_11076/g.46526  ORF Transcript_11076/g.46526 Transcript_11076/m.46526 type:complete len:806 (-) Transcript_11076:424-2841(-)